MTSGRSSEGGELAANCSALPTNIVCSNVIRQQEDRDGVVGTRRDFPAVGLNVLRRGLTCNWYVSRLGAVSVTVSAIHILEYPSRLVARVVCALEEQAEIVVCTKTCNYTCFV